MERQNLLLQNFKLEFNNYTFDFNVYPTASHESFDTLNPKKPIITKWNQPLTTTVFVLLFFQAWKGIKKFERIKEKILSSLIF
jgi:hypothetical protein